MSRKANIIASMKPIGKISPSGANEVVIRFHYGRPINRMATGFGSSWHAVHNPPAAGRAGSAFGGNPPLERRDLWEQLEAHADWLGMSLVRAEFFRGSYEPERRGKYTFDSPDMQALERILRWAERASADVILQQQWEGVAHNAFPEFRHDPALVTKSAPYDLNSFTEGLFELIRHLKQKGLLKPAKYLCITNEPYVWWKTPSGAFADSQKLLARALATVKRRLKSERLALRLIGPDFHDVDVGGKKGGEIVYPGPLEKQPWGGALVDAYDLHVYWTRFDWEEIVEDSPIRDKLIPQADAVEGARKWAANAHRLGKPFIISEFGSLAYGYHGSSPAPGWWKSNLKNVQFVIRCLNAGVDGFSRWSFTNRGDIDGQWQLVDTKEFRGWELPPIALPRVVPHQPSYAAYGMITRHCRKNSTVLASEVRTRHGSGGIPRVHAAALQDPGGGLTILITHADAIPRQIRLEISGPRRASAEKLHLFQLTDPQIPRVYFSDTSVPLPACLNRTFGMDAAIRLELPAQSITVLATRPLKDNEAPGRP